MKSKLNKISPFYLIVIGILMFLSGRYLFAKTMFMDGLIYSTIARNLSLGDGTFWDLKFTNTLYPHFHEHPPLAMGMHSLIFKIFGYSWFSDKIYSVIIFALSGIIIRKIWLKLSGDKKNAWLPLFFWVITPVIFWSISNNLLENTLTVFILLSFYSLLQFNEKENYVYLLFAGVMLFLGFLSKGFVAFYPLSFFLIYWILFRNTKFYLMMFRTFIFLSGIILPFLLLFLFSNSAFQAIQSYIETQVVKSLENVQTVESRFFIVKRLLSELIPILLIFVIIYISVYRTIGKKFNRGQVKVFLFFFLIGLTGVLPIMISLKQSGFYILSTYPFFALGFAFLLQERVRDIVIRFEKSEKNFLRFKNFAVLFFSISILYVFYFSSKYGNDVDKVSDLEKIQNYIPRETIIGILPEMYIDWSLHAYYYRYKSISLKPVSDLNTKFILINFKDFPNFNPPDNFFRVKMETLSYHLYINHNISNE